MFGWVRKPGDLQLFFRFLNFQMEISRSEDPMFFLTDYPGFVFTIIIVFVM